MSYPILSNKDDRSCLAVLEGHAGEQVYIPPICLLRNTLLAGAADGAIKAWLFHSDADLVFSGVREVASADGGAISGIATNAKGDVICGGVSGVIKMIKLSSSDSGELGECHCWTDDVCAGQVVRHVGFIKTGEAVAISQREEWVSATFLEV